jgi:hypothetical protein
MHDRIIVGRKGSGKTLYLRKLQEEAKKRDFLTISEYEALRTDTVIRFLKRIREYVYTMDRGGDLEIFLDRRKTVISVWRAVWDRAISISVLSLLLFYIRRHKNGEILQPQFSHRFKNIDELEEFVIDRYEDLFSIPLITVSPQGALRTLHEHFDSSRRLHKFLNDGRWVEFGNILKVLIAEAPPIAIYIDALDEEFENAPEAWSICQMGLYRAVAQSGFSQDSYSGRVHVVAALRDIVYAAALKGEHSDRQYQNRFIKLLEWAPAEVHEFFTEKLRRVLSQRVLDSHTLEEMISAWLGFREVQNGRGQKEAVSTYILRHSRMLPRDIILFGNAISSEIERREKSKLKFGHASLRKAVADVSEIIGTQAIGLCINEMLSSSEYFEEYLTDASDRSFTLHNFRQSLEDKLANFFKIMGRETVTLDELQEALLSSDLARMQDFEEGAQTYYRTDNILWRHGLIAYLFTSGTATKWKYNWSDALSSDVLPSRAEKIGFHPCIIDVYRIKTTRDGPVYSV